jgi:hypothetical protein
MRKSITTLTIAVLAGGPLACLGSGVGDDPIGSQQVVQIVSVNNDPATPECATDSQTGEPGQPSVDVEFTIHMVNTTTDAVTVTRIGSVGKIIESPISSEIGRDALLFESLPFSPTPTVLRARDGDVNIHVTMTLPCTVNPTPAVLAFRRFELSLRVTTTKGQYVTLPYLMRFNMRPFQAG